MKIALHTLSHDGSKTRSVHLTGKIMSKYDYIEIVHNKMLNMPLYCYSAGVSF